MAGSSSSQKTCEAVETPPVGNPHTDPGARHCAPRLLASIRLCSTRSRKLTLLGPLELLSNSFTKTYARTGTAVVITAPVAPRIPTAAAALILFVISIWNTYGLSRG